MNSIDMFPEGFIDYVLSGHPSVFEPQKFHFDEVWESEGGRLYRIVAIDYTQVGAPIIARRMDPGTRQGHPVAFYADGSQVDGGAKLIRKVPDQVHYQPIAILML